MAGLAGEGNPRRFQYSGTPIPQVPATPLAWGAGFKPQILEYMPCALPHRASLPTPLPLLFTWRFSAPFRRFIGPALAYRLAFRWEGRVMTTAQSLFDHAFFPGRPARSKPYREGVMDALRFRLGEAEHIQCPYLQGSV